MINANGNYIGFGSNQDRIIVNGNAEISRDGKYEIVKFLSGTGSFTITKASRPVEFLIVGGGGPGGAQNPYYAGGAGGGGGQVVSGSFNAVANFQYQVVVGNGGTTLPINIANFSASSTNSTVTTDGTYIYHTFTTGSGSLIVNSGLSNAEYIVLGGGGGGADGNAGGITGSEGGSGGQLLYGGIYDLQVSGSTTGSYSIVVGNGGTNNNSGGPSEFKPNFTYPEGYTLTAAGGGAGATNGSIPRVVSVSSSYYSAPGGLGASNSGSRLSYVLAPIWRLVGGNTNQYGGVRFSTLGFIDLNGNDQGYPIGSPNNCSDIGTQISSGSSFQIGTAGVGASLYNIQDCRIYNTFGANGEYSYSSCSLQFSYDEVNYYTYRTFVLDNLISGSVSCGYNYANTSSIVQSQQYDMGGNGGDGITLSTSGIDVVYGSGGGGGGYQIGTTKTAYTGFGPGPYSYATGSHPGINAGSGSYSSSLAGKTGSLNTGAGGGGGIGSPDPSLRTLGGAGGSGIVIVRYLISGSANQLCATGSNGSQSTLGGSNFTASLFNYIGLGGGAGGGQADSPFDPTPIFGINGQNGGSGGGAGLGTDTIGGIVTGSFGTTLASFGSDGAAAVAGTLSSGGGGGAGAAGSGKNGGAGKQIYISGSGAYVGAGGAAYDGTGAAGSGSYGSGGTGNGGPGATGVVIVRFSTDPADNLY
jgi:hypothetical protein